LVGERFSLLPKDAELATFVRDVAKTTLNDVLAELATFVRDVAKTTPNNVLAELATFVRDVAKTLRRTMCWPNLQTFVRDVAKTLPRTILSIIKIASIKKEP
jgi:ABC-type transporter Mla subunit MlaD